MFQRKELEGERWRGGGEVTVGHSAMWAFFCLKRSRGQHNCKINLKEALWGGSARGREGQNRKRAEWKRRSSNRPFNHSSDTMETEAVRRNGARTAETLVVVVVGAKTNARVST